MSAEILDPRYKIAMRRDQTDTLRKLRAKATELSRGELRVEALLIDAALQ
jgi:hypothetical protein